MAEEIDYIRAIKLNAMKAVSDPDTDYYLRFIYRWYSKTFFTPLHEVEDLPLEDILTAYYEESYEKLEEKELRTERLKLVWGEAEFERRLKAEQDDDDQFVKNYLAKKTPVKVEDVVVPKREKELAPTTPMPDFSVKFD